MDGWVCSGCVRVAVSAYLSLDDTKCADVAGEGVREKGDGKRIVCICFSLSAFQFSKFCSLYVYSRTFSLFSNGLVSFPFPFPFPSLSIYHVESFVRKA